MGIIILVIRTITMGIIILVIRTIAMEIIILVILKGIIIEGTIKLSFTFLSFINLPSFMHFNLA